jgi:hypothetical protein
LLLRQYFSARYGKSSLNFSSITFHFGGGFRREASSDEESMGMLATECDDFLQQTPTVPTFRVHVWTLPAPGYAENLTAYRIEDAADVLEVIDWARAKFSNGHIEVLAEVNTTGTIFDGPQDDRALIPLYGWRPFQPAGGEVIFRPA